MSELKIYKASAGSGKTYKLTGEYIDLLFRNPVFYKNILAVTFTNKASAEMKGRIVKELHNLSKGEESGYKDGLKEKYNLSDDQIKSRAKKCLGLILHDYSKFSVETIDSFFQKIILSFIREIGLQTGFTLEMDTAGVLQEVTDNMLYEIDKDIQLKKWLIDYAEEKIEEGKSWNFNADILQLGYEIFKESFKISKNDILEKTSDKKYLKDYIGDLNKLKAIVESKLKGMGKEALEIIENHNLTIDDFTQKQKGIGGFFEKLAQGNIPDSFNSYVNKCIDDTEAWFGKSSEKADIIRTTVENGLMDILLKISNIYQHEMQDYFSVSHVLRYLPVLGIITDLTKRIREYTEENNSFLISDAAEFLYKITGNNESPFIYEKTGTYYKFFMIDEFQDTSRLQWHNFKPLVLNSLSENNNALLVGDVKQSIYRWRNSDWKILAEEVNKEFRQFDINEIHLSENWRSSKNIIDFNNRVFRSMVEKLQQEFDNLSDDKSYSKRFENVYAELEQKFPEQKDVNDGYINIQYYKEEDFREESKKATIKHLEELKDKGIPLKDIAILVRGKKDGKEMAEYIIDYNNSERGKHKFEIISNDSLFISNNTAIKILVATLKYAINPNDKLNLFVLVNEYLVYSDIEKKRDKEFSKLTDRETLIKSLPENFETTIEKLKNLSVYDAVESATVFFTLQTNPFYHPYIQAFKDLIHEFSQNKTSQISSFIEWWDTIGVTKTIAINEEQDAIKIITIHKSKGLQYRSVLIPFCNWEIDHNPRITNIIWCKPKTEPFNKIDILPIQYSSKLSQTIFKEDYLEEKLQTFVDNINLQYVAFTRAKEILIVNCIEKENNKSIKDVSDLLLNTLNQNESEGWNKEKLNFSTGALQPLSTTDQAEQHNTIPKYHSVPLFERFEFTKQAVEYFNLENDTSNKIEYGKLMHNIFQMIYDEKDIDRTIHLFEIEGKINHAESEEIKSKIKEALKKDLQKEWFSGKYKIRNEAEIIVENGKTYRPDRVMELKDKIIIVDYKFSENEEEKHHNQVKNYMKLVQKIEPGKCIEGFLWYVDNDMIKKVG